MVGTLSLQEALELFRSGSELPAGEAGAFFDSLLAEQDEDILASVLTAWSEKGFTQSELFSLASLMRNRCTRVASPFETFVDIVGTGGSKVKTFNVSTAAAFVVAGAGIAVAKHGNRAATSSTGSSDVLEALGAEPAIDAETASKCLSEIGLCFMFAPNHHRLSPVLARVRRRLGFPTIFNVLGPLCNPSFPPHQLIGVWDKSLVEPTARVLARLGTRRSLVVSGHDGLDEITLDGASTVAEVNGTDVKVSAVEPRDFGLPDAKIDSVRAADAIESARLVSAVLNGNEPKGAAANLVKITSAAAISIAASATLPEAYRMAHESIVSGAARSKLTQLMALTNR